MVLSTSEDLTPGTEKAKTLAKHFPAYGSINAGPAGDTCPTCNGTGRIPRSWCFSAMVANTDASDAKWSNDD